MDNLSRFYLELATNASKLDAFNNGSNAAELVANRQRLLAEAGVEDADKLLTMDSESLRQSMAKTLISITGDWKGLEKSSSNKDNKSNIVSIKKYNH
ncbi:hypothetical protein [Bowmanella denitrificans]|uniref:hypothetical protein n=1 Tax=Bowmanella denitrificans TaxID=366582 RepID=UPI000C9B47ED|nr:hypothetical protein [Bowmanella denitrificans]